MMSNQLDKFNNEPLEDYKKRIYKLKFNTDSISWDTVADAINRYVSDEECRERKFYTAEARRWLTQGLLNDMEEQEPSLFDIMKERYKCTEERTQINAYVRKLSREETIKDIAADFADKMSTKKILDKPDVEILDIGNRQAILCISDWHYGIDVKNYFNKYDPNICRSRVQHLLDRVMNICYKENISKIHVFNLSDLICGRIHLTLRLESREDVISQTMEVSEILAEFLTHLSTEFKVEYYDCVDNHSRLEPNKKDALELETLVRIIPWYLTSRLSDNQNVTIHTNEFADDIITATILGHNVAAVHGHKDKLSKVIENMQAMTRRRNDLVLTAHYHHLSVEEEHECLRISNGSLMGTDSYAQDLRLTNKPSQNLIIVSEDDVCECLYKINLDSITE